MGPCPRRSVISLARSSPPVTSLRTLNPTSWSPGTMGKRPAARPGTFPKIPSTVTGGWSVAPVSSPTTVSSALPLPMPVTTPLVLTIAIVVWVTGVVQSFIGPGSLLGRSLEFLGLKFASDRMVAYAIGWAFVLVTIFLLGLIVDLGAKQFLQRLVDAAVRRIPIVGSIYVSMGVTTSQFLADPQPEAVGPAEPEHD